MGRLINIIIVLIAIPALILFLPSDLGGKTDFMIVQGQSMLPTILPGSFVITEQDPPYSVDEVVAFHMRQEGREQIVVHRIINYFPENDNFQTQGDNNDKPDVGRSSEVTIIGEVRYVIPYVGEMLGLFKNPVILVVLIGISVAYQMKKDKEKKRKEKLKEKYSKTTLTNEPKIDTKPPKKTSYTLFYLAMATNVLIYVGIQMSLSSPVAPKGDLITGFVYRILDPSTASTLVFGLYFVSIMSVYYFAKKSQGKIILSQQRAQKRGLVLKQRQTSKMIIFAQIFWTLFLLVGILHIITIWGDSLPLPI